MDHLEQDKFFPTFLDQVFKDGCTLNAAESAFMLAFGDNTLFYRDFFGETRGVIQECHEYFDRLMIKNAGSLDGLPVRQKIESLVLARLDAMLPYREGFRIIYQESLCPQKAPSTLKSAYQTVNTMWYEAGDKATDFNFYTKRGLLYGVFGATLWYWLHDFSQDQEKTLSFFQKRLDDVMKIPQIKKSIRSFFSFSKT
jgi:ubiquinone biosynthesis protein COQ9